MKQLTARSVSQLVRWRALPKQSQESQEDLMAGLPEDDRPVNATAQEVHSRGHPRHSGLMSSRDLDLATFDAGPYDVQVDG